MSAVIEIPVRFGDVDYARIVYYPRFFHMLHVAFEDLFATHVGIPYNVLIEERNLGLPTVHMETEFFRPMRFGEILKVRFELSKVGRSSAVFDHIVHVGDEQEPRARAVLTRVAVDMRTLRPVELPPDLRASLLELKPEV